MAPRPARWFRSHVRLARRCPRSRCGKGAGSPSRNPFRRARIPRCVRHPASLSVTMRLILKGENMDEPPVCLDCAVRAPHTGSGHTLISVYGWRLSRETLPDRTIKAVWRCGACWRTHKARRTS
jgi:hypothetical protein